MTTAPATVTPPPCPPWCVVDHGQDSVTDTARVHRAEAAWCDRPLAAIIVHQGWSLWRGTLPPQLLVSVPDGEQTLLALDNPEQVRALARLIKATGRSAQLRDALYAAADRFAEILAASAPESAAAATETNPS